MLAEGFIAGAMLKSFTCLAPIHDNARTVRSANRPDVRRLVGFDAPAMPATCLPNEICLPGDPFAACNALRGLSMSRPLGFFAAGTGNQGRIAIRWRGVSIDLSWVMLATNHAVLSETVGDRNCTPVRRPVLIQSSRYEPGALPGGPVLAGARHL